MHLSQLAFFGLFVGCATVPLPKAERFPTPAKRLKLASAEPRRLLTVDGVHLALHDSDPSSTSKPIIVCLHAIGHGGSDFNRLEADLGAHLRFITLDWPGQGASGDDVQSASARRYEVLLAGVLEQLNLGPVVLLGNSIGGATAIRYAASHPANVRALVLANPGGLDPGGFLPRLFIGNLISHFEAGAEGDPAFRAWFASYYGKILVTQAAQAQKDRIIDAGYEVAHILAQAWESFRQPEADLRSLLPGLTQPTLVTWADDDGLVQWARNQTAISTLSHAHVTHFRAGHSVFLEQPEAFEREFVAFVTALEK